MEQMSKEDARRFLDPSREREFRLMMGDDHYNAHRKLALRSLTVEEYYRAIGRWCERHQMSFIASCGLCGELPDDPIGLPRLSTETEIALRALAKKTLAGKSADLIIVDDPHAELPIAHFAGIPFYADPTLPPGTAELHGASTVRVENIKPGKAIDCCPQPGEWIDVDNLGASLVSTAHPIGPAVAEDADISGAAVEDFEHDFADFAKDIEADAASRADWYRVYSEGLRLLGIRIETPKPDILSITRDIARGGQ